MLIPGPHGGMRIYMLLTDGEVEELEGSRLEGGGGGEKASRTTLRDVLERRVSGIMRPYRFDIGDVEWISRYPISQRVISSFTAEQGHVIFVGDSAHSHSPKAAQGMNTGIQDAWNLAWKLSLVLRDKAKPELLQSYDVERKQIARQLIDFDKNFAKMFAEKARKNAPEFRALWRENSGFTSGCGHKYEAGELIDEVRPRCIDENAIEPLTPGKRLLPMELIRHVDGWKVSSLDVMPGNGSFCLVLFAGNISEEPRMSRFKETYDFIESEKSTTSKYNTLGNGVKGWAFEDIRTSDPQNRAKVIDLFVVHTSNHLKIDLLSDFEIWKYNFFEDPGKEEHKRHGVPLEGEMVAALVRPDGIVGVVCGADEIGEIDVYLHRFMKRGKNF